VPEAREGVMAITPFFIATAVAFGSPLFFLCFLLRWQRNIRNKKAVLPKMEAKPPFSIPARCPREPNFANRKSQVSESRRKLVFCMLSESDFDECQNTRKDLWTFHYLKLRTANALWLSASGWMV
jgi:hypothetical protein